MNEPIQSTPQQTEGESTALTGTLSEVIRRLPSEQPQYLFALGMGMLIVLIILGVYSIGLENPIPAVYCAMAVIAFLSLAALGVGVIGLIVQRGMSDTPSETGQASPHDASPDIQPPDEPSPAVPPPGKPFPTHRPEPLRMNQGDSPMNEYQKLRSWLDRLLDNEFRDMIRMLVPPALQTRLSASVNSIDRGTFLGDMQRLGRLDEVEHYLYKNYPDRFSC